MNIAPGAAATSPPVSVVILAYNEAKVIESVVTGFLDKVVERIPGSELVVAEDGSTDGTSGILRRLAASHPTLRLLQGRERKGYVRAFKEAVLAATNGLILFCDASGKHDPVDFWRMLPLMAANDMVIGFKEHRADPFYRIVLTRVFNGMVRTYFRVPFRDINCPLRLMRREAFAAIAEEPWILTDIINFEVTLRMLARGYRVAEIPVAHFARTSGASRGLPLNKIPKVVWRTMASFRQLKRELEKNR